MFCLLKNIFVSILLLAILTFFIINTPNVSAQTAGFGGLPGLFQSEDVEDDGGTEESSNIPEFITVTPSQINSFIDRDERTDFPESSAGPNHNLPHLFAISESSTEATLSWSNPDNVNVSSYTVSYSVLTETENFINPTEITSPTITISDLTPGTDYDVKILTHTDGDDLEPVFMHIKTTMETEASEQNSGGGVVPAAFSLGLAVDTCPPIVLHAVFTAPNTSCFGLGSTISDKVTYDPRLVFSNLDVLTEYSGSSRNSFSFEYRIREDSGAYLGWSHVNVGSDNIINPFESGRYGPLNDYGDGPYTIQARITAGGYVFISDTFTFVLDRYPTFPDEYLVAYTLDGWTEYLFDVINHEDYYQGISISRVYRLNTTTGRREYAARITENEFGFKFSRADILRIHSGFISTDLTNVYLEVTGYLYDRAGNRRTQRNFVFPLSADSPTTDISPAPVVTINDSGVRDDNITNDGNVTIALTNSNTEYYFNKVGDDTFSKKTATTLRGVAVEGKNDFIFQQIDNDSGIASLPTRLTFTLDTTVPVAPVVELENDNGVNGVVNVSGLERNATWQWRVDDGEWVDGVGSSFKVSSIAGRTERDVDVRQIDLAGNESELTSLPVNILVSTPKPVISLVEDTSCITRAPEIRSVSGFSWAGNGCDNLSLGLDSDRKTKNSNIRIDNYIFLRSFSQRLEYLVESVNSEWVEITEETFDPLIDAADGEYTVLVRAVNNEDIFVSDPFVITIDRTPYQPAVIVYSTSANGIVINYVNYVVGKGANRLHLVDVSNPDNLSFDKVIDWPFVRAYYPIGIYLANDASVYEAWVTTVDDAGNEVDSERLRFTKSVAQLERPIFANNSLTVTNPLISKTLEYKFVDELNWTRPTSNTITTERVGDVPKGSLFSNTYNTWSESPLLLARFVDNTTGNPSPAIIKVVGNDFSTISGNPVSYSAQITGDLENITTGSNLQITQTDGLPEYSNVSYQWLRIRNSASNLGDSNSVTREVTEISGATSSSYLVTESDLGHRIGVRVLYSFSEQTGVNTWLSDEIFVPEILPGAPQNIAVNLITSNSVILDWDEPLNGGLPIYSYEVVYSEFDTFLNTITNSKTRTIFNSGITITGLSPETSYSVSVKSKNAVGSSPPASTSVRTVSESFGYVRISNTTPEVGDRITALLIDNITPTSLTYEWSRLGDTEVTIGKEYLVTRDDIGSRLVLNVTYTSSTGEKTISSQTSVIPALVPDPPHNISIVETSPGNIDITYELPEFDGGSPIVAIIESITDENGNVILPPTRVENTDLRITSLLPTASTVYTVSIAAVNAIGTSEYATSTITSSSSVDSLGSASLNMRMPRVGNVLAITLTDVDNPHTLSYSWSASDVPIAGESSSTYIIRDGDVGKYITGTITYLDDYNTVLNNKNASVSASTLPVEINYPGVVQNIRTIEITHDLISLEWDAPASTGGDGTSVVSYSVEYNTGSNTPFSLIVEEGRAILRDLPSGTLISGQIRARNQLGEGLNVPFSFATEEPDVLGSVSISPETPQVGDTLTTTFVDGDTPTFVSYQWTRDGENIDTEIGASYVVSIEDAGSRVAVVVNYIDRVGSQSVTDGVDIPSREPQSPNNISSFSTQNSITLHWTEGHNGGETATLGLNYKTREGEYLESDIQLTGDTYTIEELELETEYIVRFIAVNSIGSSEKIDFAVHTQPSRVSIDFIDTSTTETAREKVYQLNVNAISPNDISLSYALVLTEDRCRIRGLYTDVVGNTITFNSENNNSSSICVRAIEGENKYYFTSAPISGIDTTSPRPPTLSLANEVPTRLSNLRKISDGSVNVFNRENGASVEWRNVGETEWTNIGESDSLFISSLGDFNIEARQTDVAGNVSSISTPLASTIEKTVESSFADYDYNLTGTLSISDQTFFANVFAGAHIDSVFTSFDNVSRAKGEYAINLLRQIIAEAVTRLSDESN